MWPVIAVLFLLLGSVACDSRGTQAVEGPVVIFPHTVGAVDELKWELYKSGGQVNARLLCTGTAKERKFKITTMVLADAEEKSSAVSSILSCPAKGAKINVGPLLYLANLEAGDRVKMSLEVFATSEILQQETSAFVMGSDGKLHTQLISEDHLNPE